MKNRNFFVAVLFFLTFLSLSAQFEEKKLEVPEKNWEKSLKFYIFMPNLELTPTVDGISPSEPIEIDFGDFINEVQDLKALAVHYEMWKNWGIILNLEYVKFEHGISSGPVSADIDNIESLLFDVAVGYELGEYPLDNQNKFPYVRFITWTGLQYNYLEESVDVNITPPDKDISLEGDERWVEPFIGLGANLIISEKLSFDLRGQAGGFGIGGSSDKNWWIIAALNYHFNEAWAANLAYKYWEYDYLKDDDFGLDATFNGPMIGVTYNF